ncbi:MAG TPA: hypothetical protein VE861_12770 [Gemmatimonadaceae bacterium]|nr:hypothetical protein [Gemmatimonadaceae bacterium]
MIQQFLTRFTGTLNRRRAYAPTHPMVRAAEEQLLEAANAALAGRSTLSIGVARTELLIDGEPWKGKSAIASELATRLHKRGVGAITLEEGLSLSDLRDALTWLATEPDGTTATPPQQGGVHITHMAYDHLVLDDAIREAENAVASLWRALAELAGVRATDTALPTAGDELFTDLDELAEATRNHVAGLDTDAIVTALRTVLHEPVVARRVAVAVMELTNHVSTTSDEGRSMIAVQLGSLLDRLGRESMTPIVRSLADTALQQRFATQVVDALPLSTAAQWLNTTAEASDHPMSQQMVRLMTKLSTLADDRGDLPSEAAFRDATHELVSGWTLEDPNPAAHAELLDRIAGFERMSIARPGRNASSMLSIVESARLVQMALELDTVGDDSVAAAEALVAAGAGRQLMEWITGAGQTASAAELYGVATGSRAVRQLLLNEPVDRLDARALLELLDVSSAEVLLDVLSESTTRGTRLIVRQRLTEFGDVIVPELLRRLDDAPWYVIRNILSILHELAAHNSAAGASSEGMLRLLDHPQVQVRVEAMRLLLLMDAVTRDDALRRALSDASDRVVTVAIDALAESAQADGALPGHLVARLTSMVDAGQRADSLRAKAVRALAPICSDALRDWLISLATRRTRILRRLTLAEPTQTAISALQVLMRVYRDDPAAGPIRAVARRDATDPRWTERENGMPVEYAS